MLEKLGIVVNPVSGRGLAREHLAALIPRLADYELSIFQTQKNDRRLADYLTSLDAAGVIVIGGDGTLSHVVNAILTNNLTLPIGVIGGGTSNDFAVAINAHNWQNPKTPDEDYLQKIKDGRTQAVDVGLVNGERYFINVASSGMATGIAHEVPQEYKNRWGKLAYYLQGVKSLPKFQSLKLRLKLDGKAEELDAYFCLVLNSTVVAGFSNVAARAELTDGKLDIIVLKKCSLPNLVKLTSKLFAGSALNKLPDLPEGLPKLPLASLPKLPALKELIPLEIEDDPNFLYYQASEVELSSDSPLESDIDGEHGPLLPLRVQVVPAAVRIFA